ncbi:MAG: hypothetical protein MUF80_11230 [Burkholderiales bacterium]|nr:hypothetical protein [Burkholderiales bacterium]
MLHHNGPGVQDRTLFAERQLRRYVDWWTTGNGFFPNAVDLSVEAGKLIQALRR